MCHINFSNTMGSIFWIKKFILFLRFIREALDGMINGVVERKNPFQM